MASAAGGIPATTELLFALRNGKRDGLIERIERVHCTNDREHERRGPALIN